jgi:hypothetical protein
MKRNNNNSQLRPEEVEALNDVEGESSSGTFKRADAQEMAKRKIFRVTKPVDISSNVAQSTNPFSAVSKPTGSMNNSEYKLKMSKLNAAFVAWLIEQGETNNASLWDAGFRVRSCV